MAGKTKQNSQRGGLLKAGRIQGLLEARGILTL